MRWLQISLDAWFWKIIECVITYSRYSVLKILYVPKFQEMRRFYRNASTRFHLIPRLSSHIGTATAYVSPFPCDCSRVTTRVSAKRWKTAYKCPRFVESYKMKHKLKFSNVYSRTSAYFINQYCIFNLPYILPFFFSTRVRVHIFQL
jgi:hypothetical protein